MPLWRERPFPGWVKDERGTKQTFLSDLGPGMFSFFLNKFYVEDFFFRLHPPFSLRVQARGEKLLCRPLRGFLAKVGRREKS
jgi:hypothetical protein